MRVHNIDYIGIRNFNDLWNSFQTVMSCST